MRDTGSHDPTLQESSVDVRDEPKPPSVRPMVSRYATETHDEQESGRAEVGSNTCKKTPIRRSCFDIPTDARKEEETNKQDIIKYKETQRKTREEEEMHTHDREEEMEVDMHANKGVEHLINMEGGGRTMGDTNSNEPLAETTMVLHDCRILNQFVPNRVTATNPYGLNWPHNPYIAPTRGEPSHLITISIRQTNKPQPAPMEHPRITQFPDNSVIPPLPDE